MCIYKTDDGKCTRFSEDNIISFCVNEHCEYEKLSNYDKIKSMSVEEMAFWIAGLISVTGRGIDGKIIKTDTVKYYEQWLLQEVSENE